MSVRDLIPFDGEAPVVVKGYDATKYRNEQMAKQCPPPRHASADEFTYIVRLAQQIAHEPRLAWAHLTTHFDAYGSDPRGTFTTRH